MLFARARSHVEQRSDGAFRCTTPAGRRTIQREVDNKLSRLLLDGQIQPGQRVTVGVADGRLTFDVQSASQDPSPASSAS